MKNVRAGLDKLKTRMLGSERLADWLPWWLPVDDGEIILTSCGGLLRVVSVALPDFESESDETLDAHHARVTAAMARLGDGWSVWFDQWRLKAPGYLPACGFGGNGTAQRIDASRRRQFTDLARPVFQNSSYLAIHYEPQNRDAWIDWLMERETTSAGAHVDFFREHSGNLLEELRASMRGVTCLRGNELASYLHACVTYRPGWREMPIGLLAPQLATREWTAGQILRVDNRHVACVELRAPGPTTALTCEGLHALDFECRWTVALHGLNQDSRRKGIVAVMNSWRIKQRGPAAILEQVVTKDKHAGETNPEVDEALATLRAMQANPDEYPFGIAHAHVHVWADAVGSSDAAHEQARGVALDRASRIVGELNGRGLETRVATINGTLAQLADMPGNVTRETANARRLQLVIPTVTRLAPVTGVSTGAREDWRFKGPALLAGLTRRGVPFYWSLNAPGSDSAHTAIVGKTGAGKSALLSLMLAQFLRYEGARAVVFDRRRSAMVTVLALGGDWIELGGGQRGVQPLRAIDRPEELAWAQDWVTKALRVRGLTITPSIGSAISDALQHVAERPPNERTLSRLYARLGQSSDARETLRHYLSGGPYGDLFDGVVESYGSSSVIGIETLGVMQLQEAAPLVLTAVFRAVQRDLLTGTGPKMVSLDEVKFLLDNELFAAEVESWVREMRKMLTALVMATQSLQEFTTMRGKAIFDQIGNRVYLPHPEAMRQQTREQYEAVGLLNEQIQLLANATPKREYLLQTEQATRLVRIQLEDDALAICGASTPADHARAFELLEQGVRPGAEFTAAWLAESTADWLERRNVASIAAE